jgi:HEAT repeat protein
LLVVVGSRFPDPVEGRTRPVRIVNLESGVLENGFPGVVLRVLSEGPASRLETVLELAAERETPSAKSSLVRLFSDEHQSSAVRMKAAVALARLGDKRGADLVRKVAMGSPSSGAQYAVRNLPYVIGDGAAAIVCDLVKRSGGYMRGFDDERQAMWLVGSQAAVPLLVELLDAGADSGTAEFALDCLADKGPDAKPSIPALLNVLGAGGRRRTLVANQRLAAKALGRIGPDASVALPALIRLAEKHAWGAWAYARAKQREPLRTFRGEPIYSEDEFVNAICKIRQATKE